MLIPMKEDYNQLLPDSEAIAKGLLLYKSMQGKSELTKLPRITGVSPFLSGKGAKDYLQEEQEENRALQVQNFINIHESISLKIKLSRIEKEYFRMQAEMSKIKNRKYDYEK